MLLLAAAAAALPASYSAPVFAGSVAASERKDDDAEEEGEEPAALADLPRAAREAVLREAGRNAIEEVEKHRSRDGTVYEAEFRVGGVEHSVRVSAAGEVLERRREVPAARLPAAVRAAAQRALPGGVIEEAEAVLGGSGAPERYELEVKVGGRTRRLTVPATNP